MGHRHRRQADLRRDRPQPECGPLHAAVGRHHHRRIVGGTRPDEWANPVADSRPAERAGPRGPDRGQWRAVRRLDGAHRRSDVRARHEERRHPLAIRSRRLGRRRPCGRQRNGVLGLGLCPHGRRRQQQVLCVQPERSLAQPDWVGSIRSLARGGEHEDDEGTVHIARTGAVD